jgi:Uncharacterized conserved protein
MTGDSITAPPQVSAPESADFLADVIAGLSSNPRTIPCKYFYDERGAALFQKICELPEYYVTRTEIDILDRSRADIASQLGPNLELIGLGTGAGTKTRILIEALENPAVYIPSISRKNNCANRLLFSGKFFQTWKFCRMRGLPQPVCCLRPVTNLRETLCISRDRPSATSSRMKPCSFCVASRMSAAEAAGCSSASI